MNLSNENRLLLYCTQTNIPETTLDQVRSLVSLPLNWEEVLESAFWHDVAPLLYHNLKTIQGIPQKVIDQLKKAYNINAAKNTYFYVELNRVLEAFHEKGVEVIVLKGAALAQTVYVNIALRSFSDIDLLVEKDDLPYAQKIMSELNYVAWVDGKSQEWHKKNHHHLSPYIHLDKSLDKSMASTIVEIHWHITNQPFHIDIDEWWRRAKGAKIAGCNALMLSPEDMLIHLCLHLFNHGYDKSLLRGLCDISETLRHYKDELNWAQFQDGVNKYGVNKLVYSVLYLIKKLRQNNGNFPNWLEPAEVNIDLKLVALVEERIFTKNNTFSRVPGPLVQFLAADRLGDRVKILLHRIFPTHEVMSSLHSTPLSSKKLYFHYLARLCRLILRYGRFISDVLKE